MTAAIAPLIERAIAERVFPGAVVLAAHGTTLLHHAAYGSTMYTDAGSRSVATTTIYDIASLTKVFTATAALILADAREIDLDAPLLHYLPAVRAHDVTLRHLLTHSSGLDLRLSMLRERGAAGIRAAVYAAQPVHAPGSLVAYTNINSMLLGDVIAAVCAAPLDAAIAELISVPLGLTATQFNPPAELRERIAPTEWDKEWRGGLVHGQVHDESAYALGGVAGHAGLFSTAADLARLMQLWLHGGAWGGRQLLREATVAEALRDHTAHLTTPGGLTLHSGLGWMLDRAYVMGAVPRGSFGHTGFTGSVLIGVPAVELLLVLLSNRVYPQRTPPPYRHHAVTAEVLGALTAI
jgi:CubicO group peptidase (beta-lactamase class C family)